jgi:hypothetical protein
LSTSGEYSPEEEHAAPPQKKPRGTHLFSHFRLSVKREATKPPDSLRTENEDDSVQRRKVARFKFNKGVTDAVRRIACMKEFLI